MRNLIPFFWVVVVAVGCGEGLEEIVLVPDPCVHVLALDGTKKTIPSAQLYEEGTGQPTVDSVMVVDRATRRQLYIKMEELATAAQARSRYVLVTEAPCQPEI